MASHTAKSTRHPKQIDRFRIHAPLGNGSYGQVYLATDPLNPESYVAVKVAERHGLTPEGRHRFAREAQAAMNIVHPNLCRVMEVGETEDGSPFLVMTYIPGHSLEEVLLKQLREKHRPIPVLEAAQWMATLAWAMEEAHSQGVLHRDLKPGNIVWNRETNQLVIVDFGMAKFFRDAGQLNQARISNTPIGTPLYMPLEQANGQTQNVGPWSDVYSLGGILYEMVCGRTVFLGNNFGEILTQLLNATPRPPSAYYVNVPPELDHICMKALARNFRDRYQSARELAEALTNFVQQHPQDDLVKLVEAPTVLPKPSPQTNVPTGSYVPPTVRPTLPPAQPERGHVAADTPERTITAQNTQRRGKDQLPSETKRPSFADTVGPSAPPAQPPLRKPVGQSDPTPRRSPPIPWSDVRRVSVGLVVLALFGFSLCQLAISTRRVAAPPWYPHFLLPGDPPPPARRDAALASWATKLEGNSVLVRAVNRPQPLTIRQEKQLAQLGSVEVLGLTIRNPESRTTATLNRELTALPTLEFLDLAGSPSLANLDFLKQIPHLQRLDLSQGSYPNAASPAEEDAAIHAILSLKQLKCLNLSGSQFPSRLLSRLAESNSTLAELHLGQATSSQLTDAACRDLSRLAHLKVLNLSGASISPPELRQLLPEAKAPLAQSLVSLNLAGTRITAECLTNLAHCQQIKELDLSRCYGLRGQELYQLGAIRNLESLRLEGMVDLEDSAGAMLANLARLRRLKLSKCPKFGTPGLAALNGKNLEQLELDGTAVDDQILYRLATWFPMLRHLNLTNTAVTPNALSRAQLPTSLMELHLSGECLSHEAILHVVTSREKTLRKLAFSGGSLKTATLREALRKLPELQELRLDSLTDLSSECVFDLQEHRGLRKVVITNCNISGAAIKTLQEVNPHCEYDTLNRER